MPEYGRNVQKMVEYLITVDDREKRLQQAEIIIELMGTLNPHLKTIEDYKHKLWDHLFQMTEFKLDVDAPYECPTPESVFKKPEVLPYPQEKIKTRHLGKNVQKLLEKAIAETDEETRQGLTQAIGYYMKLAYGNWHKEPVHDDMIKSELAELSGGLLKYEPGGFKVHFDNPSSGRNFKGGNGRGGNNNRNFKGNNRNNNFRDNNSGGNYGGNYKNKKYKNKNK